MELSNYVKSGEIGIFTLLSDGTLVFVDVKSNIAEEFGGPVELVNPWNLKM